MEVAVSQALPELEHVLGRHPIGAQASGMMPSEREEATGTAFCTQEDGDPGVGRVHILFHPPLSLRSRAQIVHRLPLAGPGASASPRPMPETPAPASEWMRTISLRSRLDLRLCMSGRTGGVDG